jgi:hypothetical protein
VVCGPGVLANLVDAFFFDGREIFFPRLRPMATWLRIRFLAVLSVALPLSTNSNFIP